MSFCCPQETVTVRSPNFSQVEHLLLHLKLHHQPPLSTITTTTTLSIKETERALSNTLSLNLLPRNILQMIDSLNQSRHLFIWGEGVIFEDTTATSKSSGFCFQ